MKHDAELALARAHPRQQVAQGIWSLARSNDPDVVDRSAGFIRRAASAPSLGRSEPNYSRRLSFAMADVSLLSLARDLRARAQEILAKAETMYDTEAGEAMREVAARHEKLAQRVEQGPGATGM